MGGALAAYLLGPRLVNTDPHACKKTFIDCPPVRWFAKKGVTRYEGMKCHCPRCSLEGAGIQMRPKQQRKLKFSKRLTVIQHTVALHDAQRAAKWKTSAFIPGTC